MSNDNDRESLLQLENQILDLGRRNWVQCGARFVHQQDFWIHRQRARDAQALLLAAGKAGARFLLEHVLDFVPKRRLLQRSFDDIIECFMVAGAV